MMTLMMEGVNHEEDQSQMMIIKGKRTKRQRLSSPIVLATTTASSSSSPGGVGDVEDHHHHYHHHLRVVRDHDEDTTTSAELLTEMGTTEEEEEKEEEEDEEEEEEEDEDIANCLILLAQSGHQTRKIPEVQEQQHQLLLQPIKGVAAVDTAPGLYVYECKTCNRCFSSFQALGGHRASHKKPKQQADNNAMIPISTTQPKKALAFMEDHREEYVDIRRFNSNAITSTTLSLQVSSPNRVFGNNINSKRNKVHECSVCGAEFTSGQALGGHMRRHRTLINSTTTTATATMSSPQHQSQGGSNKRPRSVLELDLNLPAPEEERLEMTKLPFASSKNEQVIVFSASPLVGSNY